MKPECSVIALLALALGAAGCERPDSLLVCHNANCVEPPNPREDDTLDALRASLALRQDGRPVIDGVEMDLFWDGAAERCLFAHDLGTADAATAPNGIEAGELIAQHITGGAPISWNGEQFVVMIELKPVVGTAASDRHSPAQRIEHAACALDVFAIVDAAATTANENVDVIFIGFDPDLFRTLVDDPRWPEPGTTRAVARLAITQGIPAPLDAQTHSLGDFDPDLPIDMIELHSQWLLDAQYEAYVSAGYDLAFWMFSATVETFAAIERYRPTHVVTNEARLMRRWLER